MGPEWRPSSGATPLCLPLFPIRGTQPHGSHGEQSIRLADDNRAAARAVIEEKRSRGEFKLLLGYFGR